jgi:hypothetical protein
MAFLERSNEDLRAEGGVFFVAAAAFFNVAFLGGAFFGAMMIEQEPRTTAVSE